MLKIVLLANTFDQYTLPQFVVIKMIIRTCNLLCSNPMSNHPTSKSHVKYRIFKGTLIHASMIQQIRLTQWIQWKVRLHLRVQSTLRFRIHLSSTVHCHISPNTPRITIGKKSAFHCSLR